MHKNIDRFDLKILVALQKNARITTLNLSDEVGLSASPCHTRMRRLEKGGFVGPYRAEVNINKLVHTLTAIVPLELSQHEAKHFTAFERAIANMPEIVECSAVGGGFDYVLKVVTRDVESYQHLMEGLLKREIGISRYFSYFVTKPIKKFAGYSLEALLDQE
ncbi:Lrp/AsnC family transcriptional regulator [Mesorhizobium sp.]|uniref:Lrp/AsnC family transcriptional regulator n=1 Tax=Mesorhizobium sp. TaxID=1871066 RepID=UPI000FE34995|nr:Lrp/AsnC family transcriptional regulator [Mesorhizobium sp.]RWN48871.1 MAG: Lrp/AsnC family transcriptional regulator [Mesorhizobium sp.]RWN69003.1 MAG: Lrp/AsnC family transcriptional regulator [Mesorhizobium sp.]RWN69583.1 MAG: Lrp/AsnC family transcriptional regulator [Mesorhizobium sp.]RWN81224.1 MAG: Lrp/AsnC family transcriptional regulator [Mesorhizobium sp.]RWO05751.1 MAG: Lrp/AsnC family transcriptional regulator [Mesorhizobium sp.]